MLDLGPRARVAFAACWIAAQAALVVTASARPDHIFGFRMFSEASTFEIQLSRVTTSGLARAPLGAWTVRSASGQIRHFSWHDRVRDPILGALERRLFASYGVDAQLARLQVALDDVAGHLEGDDETRRLRADVRIWKNGREPYAVTLLSSARAGL